MLSKDRYFDENIRDKVATAIKDKFPNESIEIWKSCVARGIRQVNQKGYNEAGGYLSKIRKLMLSKNMNNDWDIYITAIRKENYRRPRFIGVLNNLDNILLKTKPLIIS